MFMDVTLEPVDGFGRPVGDSLHAFWFDGSKLQDVLEDRLIPADPWQAWTCLMDIEEVRDLAANSPCVWAQRSDLFNEKMAALIDADGARSIAPANRGILSQISGE